jgi:GH15 family glucan-1,4-alpha-glucosidase
MTEEMISEETSYRVNRSVQSILDNQEKNGAIVASPDFAQYHFCWLRDGSFCSYALDLAGEHEASARYHSWVNNAVAGIADVIDSVIAKHERGDDLDRMLMPPARFALDGTTVIDDWPNFQIDGYGTWLWSLGQHLERTGSVRVPEHLFDSVNRVARYLLTFALSPCYDVWEENGDDVHTSTLACVYGGLVAARRLLGNADYAEAAETVRERVLDDAARASYFVKSNSNDDVDGSLLWLSAPFGLVSPMNHYFGRTVALIEDRLSFEGGIRRYDTDVYFGSGSWPVLTASLGWHYVVSGDLAKAIGCRDWITARIGADGQLGEQFGGEKRDTLHYQEWVTRWGLPARNLTWSHAMYVVLSQAIEKAKQ